MYKLNIIASDMNGKAGGNSGSGEIEIRIRDINDNVPMLEKESVCVTPLAQLGSLFFSLTG